MIYVVGHTAIDHISRVHSIPPRNASAIIIDRKIFFGGGAANIAAGIAQLGEASTLVSAIGDDFAGSGYERWLEELKVQRQFFTVPGTHTATAFMFTDESGDQITFFEWGASKVFRVSEPAIFPFVHMATADPVFNVKVAERAGFSSFDPGQDIHRYDADQLDTILSRISLLFANQHEFEGMCRILGIQRKELIEKVPMAVFTRGAMGSTLYHGGGEEHIPAIPVKMADPTGAGDAYRAGFLTAFVRGFPPSICCRVGSVCASFVVEVPGCQTNLPDWEQMGQRYRNSFGTSDDIP